MVTDCDVRSSTQDKMDKVIKLVANAWSELVWASERQEMRHEGMRDLDCHPEVWPNDPSLAVHLLLIY